MRLETRGHPLHTRALAVTLVARADGKLDAHGSVVDLRKRGFVPVAGDLQGCGVIHDMRLSGVIDPGAALLESLGAEQRNVAFEPSALTGGESCRDPIARVGALAGTRLDAGWARRLAAEIGGPRGCSHLLTLGHLLGGTAAWALERERALHGGAAIRPAGQRVFRRDLVIDGIEPSEGHLDLAVQLTDLHFAPTGALAFPMERFAEELELRLQVEVDFTTGQVLGVTAGERRRGRDDLEHAVWQDRTETGAWVVGRRIGAGFATELLARLGDAPNDRPLLDALLNLAPALLQCAAAMSEVWPLTARAAPSLVGMSGIHDSCWMWRRGGALVRASEAEGGRPPRRS